MPLVVLVLVLAVGLSYLRGGRLRRIEQAPLRWNLLLFVGVALQVVVDQGAGRGRFDDASTEGYLLLLVSQVLVLAWVAANWLLPGMPLVTLGLLLNALVIGANGAMPVDPQAIRALGLGELTVPPGKHTLMTDSTRLPWLADIWALPPLRTIVSVGDVVLAAGLIPLTHALMSYRTPEERRTPQRQDDEEAVDADAEAPSDGEIGDDVEVEDDVEAEDVEAEDDVQAEDDATARTRRRWWRRRRRTTEGEPATDDDVAHADAIDPDEDADEAPART